MGQLNRNTYAIHCIDSYVVCRFYTMKYKLPVLSRVFNISLGRINLSIFALVRKPQDIFLRVFHIKDSRCNKHLVCLKIDTRHQIEFNVCC